MFCCLFDYRWTRTASQIMVRYIGWNQVIFYGRFDASLFLFGLLLWWILHVMAVGFLGRIEVFVDV